MLLAADGLVTHNIKTTIVSALTTPRLNFVTIPIRFIQDVKVEFRGMTCETAETLFNASRVILVLGALLTPKLCTRRQQEITK